MAAETTVAHAGRMPAGQAKLILYRTLQILASVVVWAAILFACAGTFDYPRGWIWLAVYLFSTVVTGIIVVTRNPEVMAARARTHADAKTFDKVFSITYAGLLFAIAILAPLDVVRYRWSAMPFDYVYAGVLLYLLAGVPVAWAMMVNPFLETQVRIQIDRGHRVIAHGPYAVVRHPMYAGMFAGLLGIPFVLGSWWTFAIIAAVLVTLVWRTYMEDKTLRRELPGYEEYTRKTRYRLLPGLW